MSNLSEQILNQIDRQINFAYFMAGIVVSIAIFIVGYQVYINSKALSRLKEDNRKEIDRAVDSLNTDFLLGQLNSSFDLYNEKQIDSWLKVYSNIKNPEAHLIIAMKEIKIKYLFSILDSDGFFNIMSNYPVKEKIKKEGVNEGNKSEYIAMYLTIFDQDIEDGKTQKEELIKHYEKKAEVALNESAKFEKYGL